MGVPPAAKNVQLLGSMSLGFTNSTGNRFTSQPESHKQAVNTPYI